MTSRGHLGRLHPRQSSQFVDLSATPNRSKSSQQHELLRLFFFYKQSALTAKLSKQEQEVETPVQVERRIQTAGLCFDSLEPAIGKLPNRNDC